MPSSRLRHRGVVLAGYLAVGSIALTTLPALTSTAGAVPGAPVAVAAGSDPVGDRALLTDPFLQAPTASGVSVAWFTEFAGAGHAVLVGDGVAVLTAEQLAAAAQGTTFPGVRAFAAESSQLSQVAEDYQSNIPAEVKPAQGDGIVDRDVWRHEGVVTDLEPGTSLPYRVVSIDGSAIAGSGTFRLQPAARPGDDLDILLTSDHQAMVNTPANLQVAAETIGGIDAVFLAGDLVNIPDRASEWFDDTRGSGFFPVLQGNGGRVSTGGVNYVGGEIVQNAPLYPAVGNHEVQGRRDGAVGLNASYNNPVPRDVAEQAYEAVAADVNPTGDPEVRERWIVDNSFSTTTYEEVFTLPDDSPGGETYYATTVGDVRLVSLYSTRIWRGTTATPDPAARTGSSRYQEASTTLDDPLLQGHGEHIFEAIDASSEQYAWLADELASEEFAAARYHVVMLHEGPQGLGDNVMPQFADPQRIEETNDAGEVVGIRYEYPATENELLYDLQPLLEDAGVDLVHNGHSHLWNRFLSENGTTNWIETSNTGNSYGAYHPLSGRSRPVPPAPWVAENYWAQDNPGGLAPIAPNVAPYTNADGQVQPFVQNNNLAVFTKFNTGSGEITTYSYDVRTPDRAPRVIDVFTIGEPDDSVAPTVTTRPAHVTVVEGEDATFTAAATGTPEPTVQWQVRRRGAEWVDLDGATSSTLTVAGVTRAQNGEQYRAVFTNTAGTTESAAAVLTVEAAPGPVPGSVAVGSRITIEAPYRYGRIGSPKPFTTFLAGHDGNDAVTGRAYVTARKVGTSDLIVRAFDYDGATTRMATPTLPSGGSWQIKMTFVPDEPVYATTTRSWWLWVTPTGR
ncbi:MAG TPA: immunoglobulin domain-containing protein [Nocardioides sp.]